MRFCSNCGTIVRRNESHCSQCGEDVLPNPANAGLGANTTMAQEKAATQQITPGAGTGYSPEFIEEAFCRARAQKVVFEEQEDHETMRYWEATHGRIEPELAHKLIAYYEDRYPSEKKRDSMVARTVEHLQELLRGGHLAEETPQAEVEARNSVETLRTRSHRRYALMLLATGIAILVIVRLLVYAHLLAEDEAAFTFFAFLFWPAFFIGRKWLEFYRETHPHGESNRAMRIIRSLPPECQDHVLRFLEAERFSSGQVDIDRETERIADILRTIPTEKQEAVLATVARTVEEEPEHDESFYNVGFYS